MPAKAKGTDCCSYTCRATDFANVTLHWLALVHGGVVAKQNTTEPTISTMRHVLVTVKGAGDLATGVIHRLKRAGFTVMATELAQPTVLRRSIAFAEAIALGKVTVEGITAQHVHALEEIPVVLENGSVPVLIDPEGI